MANPGYSVSAPITPMLLSPLNNPFVPPLTYSPFPSANPYAPSVASAPSVDLPFQPNPAPLAGGYGVPKPTVPFLVLISETTNGHGINPTIQRPLDKIKTLVLGLKDQFYKPEQQIPQPTHSPSHTFHALPTISFFDRAWIWGGNSTTHVHNHYHGAPPTQPPTTTPKKPSNSENQAFVVLACGVFALAALAISFVLGKDVKRAFYGMDGLRYVRELDIQMGQVVEYAPDPTNTRTLIQDAREYFNEIKSDALKCAVIKAAALATCIGGCIVAWTVPELIPLAFAVGLLVSCVWLFNKSLRADHQAKMEQLGSAIVNNSIYKSLYYVKV